MILLIVLGVTQPLFNQYNIIIKVKKGDLPVSPRPALETLALNPRANAQLTLLDLDLLVFALLVLASSTGALCFLWGLLA